MYKRQASELSIRETVDGSVTSTSYVNPDGVITDAIDMGYATVCRMRDDNGRVVEERYLDASGKPVVRYGDYYGLSYGYDETGTVITYLDAERNPVKRSAGYLSLIHIFVRESGTESVVRVMVEAPDHDTCQKYVSQVVETIKSRGYGV